MDERKAKRIYHPPAVPVADLFKGGKQRHVAAYARVSTASDEQLNSVEVFFEKENIYTMDSKGEFLITLLSSIAEEESRSISENVKWGQRKRFADGKYSVPYKHFLGSRKGADGSMEIVPEEARVVRWIYHMFLEGIAPTAIATILTTTGIPSPSGGNQWWPKTVMSILTNEKYYGAAGLQKTYIANHITHEKRVDNGELPGSEQFVLHLIQQTTVLLVDLIIDP